MRTKTTLILCTLIITGSLFANPEKISSKCSINPVELTCEYLNNPQGLDVKQPRFSWTLTATDKTAFGQRQSAYRILVSSSTETLNKNEGDSWDSGWLQSDDMQLIRYNGKPLRSDENYF